MSGVGSSDYFVPNDPVTWKTLRQHYAVISRRAFGQARPLPIGSTPLGDGSFYLDFQDDGSVDWVSEERGREYHRERVRSLDHVLYMITDLSISAFAIDYEVKNRIDDEDSRRQYFSMGSDMMGQVSSEWQDRWDAKIESILKRFPYHDEPLAPKRVRRKPTWLDRLMTHLRR